MQIPEYVKTRWKKLFPKLDLDREIVSLRAVTETELHHINNNDLASEELSRLEWDESVRYLISRSNILFVLDGTAAEHDEYLITVIRYSPKKSSQTHKKTISLRKAPIPDKAGESEDPHNLKRIWRKKKGRRQHAEVSDHIAPGGVLSAIEVSDETISRLEELEPELNDGRGSKSVKKIIAFLNAGDINKAKRVWNIDHYRIAASAEVNEILKRCFSGNA